MLRNLFIFIAKTFGAVVSISMFVFLFPFIIIKVIFRKSFNLKDGQKCFIGIHEIVNNIHSIQHNLDKFGYKTSSLVEKSKHHSDDNPYAKLSNRSNRLYLPRPQLSLFCFFYYSIIKPIYLHVYFYLNFNNNKTWIFVWNETFIAFHLDLLILCALKKNLIFLHCGDDVRYRPMQTVIDEEFGIRIWNSEKKNNLEFLRKFYFVWLCEKFGKIISTKDSSCFYSKNYYQGKHFIYPANPGKYSENKCVTIVHAPTDRNIKGTHFVLDALKLLEDQGYRFEFILIENKSNIEVLNILETADIVIDQPNLTVARLSAEGCAARCCVITGNHSEYGVKNCPVIQFYRDSHDLSLKIENLLNDSELLEAKKEECYNFWKENYSPESHFSFINDIINDIRTADLKPIHDQKRLLLESCNGTLQSFVIKNFYNY